MMIGGSNPAPRRSLTRRLAKRVREAASWTRHRADQLRHLARRPPLTAVGRHILAELRREGVATVPLEELRFASSPALLAAMPRACQQLDRMTHEPARRLEYEEGFDHCIPINPSTIASELPELFMWGLDESLLDVVERYLGLEVAYHGVCVRKELLDGGLVGTRLWHRDNEDLQVIRVMIYLSDVLDDESGPFEYIPRHSSPTYRDFRGVEAITDAHMKRVVPEWRWRRAKGPRGTVIFGAVAEVFHHGKVPATARKMASFYYTSRHPTNPTLCRMFSFESGIPHMYEPLTDRQRACLWSYQELLPAPGERRAQPVVRSTVSNPPPEVDVAPSPAPDARARSMDASEPSHVSVTD